MAEACVFFLVTSAIFFIAFGIANVFVHFFWREE